MFEVGKYYAQFCFYDEDEYVFVCRIDNIDDGQVGMLSYAIEIGLIDKEDAMYSSFDDDKYVEIEKSLFDAVVNDTKGEWQCEDAELSMKYIAIFKEICKGHWRDLAEDD